jgi:hypothetical protein
MTDWTEDTDYQHPTLEWLFRYVAIANKSAKSRTARTKKVCRLEDFYRLIDLSKMEHADCDHNCEVRGVLAAIERDEE